ncbi:hypothetical protein SNEBB_009333 [Seison nebaliae]|nr:hypothetical protein SNEBB_009333 [Seison nebaliae]
MIFNKKRNETVRQNSDNEVHRKMLGRTEFLYTLFAVLGGGTILVGLVCCGIALDAYFNDKTTTKSMTIGIVGAAIFSMGIIFLIIMGYYIYQNIIFINISKNSNKKKRKARTQP